MTPPSEVLFPADEPPVTVRRTDGRSPFLLTCDHAGRQLPTRLGRLGLPDTELERHIAYDIGAADTSRLLSDTLDAVLVEQRYSRLVIDCNRPPGTASAIPEISESTTITGNLRLTRAERQARVAEIFRPYHDRIAAEIDERLAGGRRTVLIAMHSFTPVYKGVPRPWHVGTLYGRDGRLAEALGRLLREEAALTVGDNEPYAVTDETDYTIPTHGEGRGLIHVGIEIRQDLLADPAGQADWAARLARVLPAALAVVDGAGSNADARIA